MSNTIYKLYAYWQNEWVDTCERGTKDYLAEVMAISPDLYSGCKYKLIKCKDQSLMDRHAEFIGLLNNIVRQ